MNKHRVITLTRLSTWFKKCYLNLNLSFVLADILKYGRMLIMQLFGFSVFRPIQGQRLNRRIVINRQQPRPEIKNIQPTVVLIVRSMNIKCFILRKRLISLLSLPL